MPEGLTITVSEAATSTSSDINEEAVVKISSDLLADLPKAFSVRSVAPNPFNASTTLTFGLPNASEVGLDLYDVAGHRVRRILDQSKYGAGWHRVFIDSKDLASGIYFYEIRSAGERESGKIVVVR